MSNGRPPAGRRWWRAGSIKRRLASRRARQLTAALLAVGVVVAVLAVLNREPALRVSSQTIRGTAEPDGRPVLLDSSLYLPERTPAPAILLAHGFGGSKTSVDGQARTLARAGYVVLTYSARGFGASGGLIHLDSRRYEVADGSRLLDYLQGRPEVARTGDRPVLGVAGSSYGGALALMLGATDRRVGAVAADITWNSLARSLFPNAADSSPGVFKKLWAGYLFSSGFGPEAAGDGDAGSSSCGRFAAELCASYQQTVAGRPTCGWPPCLPSRAQPACLAVCGRRPC